MNLLLTNNAFINIIKVVMITLPSCMHACDGNIVGK